MCTASCAINIAGGWVKASEDGWVVVGGCGEISCALGLFGACAYSQAVAGCHHGNHSDENVDVDANYWTG